MRYKSSVYKSFVLVMQFGINMLVPIFLCTFIGLWIGDKTNIDFMAVPFFGIGALAGFRNCYIMAKRVYTEDDRKKRDEKKSDKDINNVKKVK